MGEYLSPPLGILQLATYLESKDKSAEIEVLDCQAHRLNWNALEKCIESSDPDIVASSTLATCNAYVALRTLETAKRVKPAVLTVLGGQHFTVTAHESLDKYPVIDVIVRGEGKSTLVELVKVFSEGSSFSRTKGISYRQKEVIRHNPPRPLIENLNDLPFPGYHFVDDVIHRYHFNMMTPSKNGYALS
jgi:anaerobic magnesium-protoporphyrin IX monomethyl ester cyclase